MKKIILFLSFLSLLVCSNCNDIRDEESNVKDDPKIMSLTKKEKIRKEAALLVGRALVDKNVRDVVLAEMKNVSKDAEIISFGYLLKKNNGLRKNEMAKVAARPSDKLKLFSEALNSELKENPNDYSVLNSIASEKRDNSTARVPIDQIGDVLASENLQLYSPYNELNGFGTAVYSRYYTSSEMVDGSPTNSGYYFNGSYETYIQSMDNNFIDSRPSFIISEIDECDLHGGTCRTVELLPTSMPPPLTNQPTLLTYSVDHANIPDSDIITSRIPMIKVRGTDWMGFGGTHQKLRFFRGSYEGGLTQNNDGSITVTGLKYQVGADYRTKRKNVKRQEWLTFDNEFDPDWNQSENTEQMVVFSLHNFSSSANFEGGVKYGLKKDDKGNWVGTPEVTGSASVKFSTGSARERANVELSRRQVLSTIIGGGSTGKTYNDGGVDYNVKSLGIVDFYFKHWYTDLN